MPDNTMISIQFETSRNDYLVFYILASVHKHL